jgi:hypothetical protein
MNRGYEILQKNHAELLSRAESARISQDARVDTESVRFRIVEPPEVPIVPIGPDRTIFLIAVLLGSIGGGLGVGFLLSETEQTFASPQSLREAFGLPVLGSVCWIPSRSEKVVRFFDTVTVSAGAGAMVAFTAFLVVFSSDLATFVSEADALRDLSRNFIESVY